MTIRLKDILNSILDAEFKTLPVESRMFRVVIPDMERDLKIDIPYTSHKVFIYEKENGFRAECYRLCDFDISTNFYQFNPREETASSHLSKYKEVRLMSNGLRTNYKAYYYIPRNEEAVIEMTARFLGRPNPCERMAFEC